MLASDGDDRRKLPLTMRKTNLASYWRGASTASTLRHSSKARSGHICFGTPA